jgi:hypothetical protein
MSAAAVVIATRCHYCSKQRAPHDVHRIVDIRICRYCFEDHERRMLALRAVSAPSDCPECKTLFSDLAEAPGNCGEVKMVLVPKDGAYQFLCQPCAGRYVRKRVDLFGPTAFGRRMKLT